MFKKVLTVAAFLVVASIFGVVSSHPASADYHQSKVTICHATDSATNPYEKKSVDLSAVDGVGNNDHSHHTGPVAYSETQANQLKSDHIHWGDIIPPTVVNQTGLNWNDIGKAVYYNDCNYPKTATASISVLGATCSDGQKLVYGSISNASFSGTANGTYGPQDYSVTATASSSALFFGSQTPTTTLTFTGTLSGPLTGEQCDTPVEAAPVTFVDPTCSENNQYVIPGQYTIPTSTGIDYQIDGTTVAAGTYNAAAGTTVTVTAVAQSGYKIDEGKTVWSWTFSTPENCPQVPNKPDDIVTTNTSSSVNCSTKLVTTITTTSRTTFSLQDNEWVANEPVITSDSTSRAATTDELTTCPNDTTELGQGSAGGPTVTQLPYTSGDGTLATVLTLSAIAGAATVMSVLARRVLGRQV
jgi:hypothetical protein